MKTTATYNGKPVPVMTNSLGLVTTVPERCGKAKIVKTDRTQLARRRDLPPALWRLLTHVQNTAPCSDCWAMDNLSSAFLIGCRPPLLTAGIAPHGRTITRSNAGLCWCGHGPSPSTWRLIGSSMLLSPKHCPISSMHEQQRKHKPFGRRQP